MTTIEYKGYIAEVDYDDQVGVFCGWIANTERSPVVFEVAEESRLRQVFEEAVDDYLEWCADDGVEPLLLLPLAGQTKSESSTPQPAASGGDGN